MRTLLVLVVMLMAGEAVAQTVTLPLEGYARKGKWVAVHVFSEQKRVRVGGRGVIETRIERGTGVDEIVPVMVVGDE
ncbi:MAG TPA: hypothetical protein VF669_08530, partial [Tepidisphaeraceae bacterium]